MRGTLRSDPMMGEAGGTPSQVQAWGGGGRGILQVRFQDGGGVPPSPYPCPGQIPGWGVGGTPAPSPIQVRSQDRGVGLGYPIPQSRSDLRMGCRWGYPLGQIPGWGEGQGRGTPVLPTPPHPGQIPGWGRGVPPTRTA